MTTTMSNSNGSVRHICNHADFGMTEHDCPCCSRLHKPKTTKKAAFRKFLTATKNKMKSPKIQIEGGKAAASAEATEEEEEEFQRRKQEWQEELDDMSEFLVLKSTEEQREEGVEQPVDTAYIEDRDGMPILKAVFDIHLFKPNDVQLQIDGNALVLEAKATDDRDIAVFRKTMLRRLELPEHVDAKMMKCDLSKEGILAIEMPFHMPPQRRPVGPSIVPITEGPDGQRQIRMAFAIGPDFCSDDLKVESNGKSLVISAHYDAVAGKYGEVVQERDFKKEFNLPDRIEVDSVHHTLSPDGRLYVVIKLKDEPSYKCEVTTKDVADDMSLT